jgi:hypothetical protein
VRYFGQEHIAGRPCHRITLRRADADWQIWIDATAPYVPRRVAITPFDRAIARPRLAVFEDWNLADNPPQQAFAVPLPEGAYEVEAIDFFGLP